jgi:hypothetical protein
VPFRLFRDCAISLLTTCFYYLTDGPESLSMSSVDWAIAVVQAII